MTRQLRFDSALPLWKTLIAAVFLAILSVTLLDAQTYQTGISPLATVGGGPDDINLADNTVHFSFPVFSRAGRGLPLSFGFLRDTTGWTQKSIPNGSQWSPAFGDYIPANSILGFIEYTPSCTDSEGGKHTYNLWEFSSFQDLQGNSHPFGIVISYSNVPQPRGTCPGPNTTGSAMASDGSGIMVSLSLGCAGSTGGGACASVTATLRDGSVMYWPAGASPTWTDSNGNRITYNMTSGGLSSITDTLGTTALTYSTSGVTSRTATYTSPYGSPASVTMLFQQYNVQTTFACSGISDYPATSWALPYQVNLPDGSYYQLGYETLSNGHTTGRIASVRLPTGATISYYYSGGTNGVNCVDGSIVQMTRTTPDGTWVYRRALTLDSLGRVQYSTNTIQDPQNNQTVMTFSGYGAGLEMQRQVYQGSVSSNPCSSTITTNCLLATTITCYNGLTPVSSCPTAVVSSSPPSEIAQYTSLNGGPYSEVDMKLNSYSLPTEKDEYDFGATTPTRKTSISYATIGNGAQDRPSILSVKDGNGNVVSQTTYTYDQDVSSLQPSGAGQLFPPICSSGTCRGNSTTRSSYVSSSAYLTKTFTHYDTGQVYQANDVNSAQTTFTYGECGNSLMTNVSLPLSLSGSYTWNCNGGVQASATDENGKTSFTNYTTDPYFWRPNSTQDQIGNTTTLTYASPTQSEASLEVNSSSYVDVVNTLDSLGRSSLAQRRQAPPSGTYFDTVLHTYNSDGRPFHTTMPCQALRSAGCSTPFTAATYDGLGRPLTVVDGGGGTATYTYTQKDVLIAVSPAPTGENVKQRQLEYDGLGRLTSVCEITSATGLGAGSCGQTNPETGFLTTYAYDVLGNLLTVTQNAQPGALSGQQSRTYAYDYLSRLTSESNPESGTTTYFWDAAPSACYTGGYATPGDLGAKKDNAGVYTCYGYDALHRLLGTSHADASENCRNYGYDSGTPPAGVSVQNTKGRLIEASTDSACNGNASLVTDEWFSYDADGRLTDVYESTPNSGGYYHSTASYWPHGGLETLGLLNTSGTPFMPTQTYGVDSEGRMTSVTAASGQSPVSAVTYIASGTTEPIGSLTQVTFGSLDSDGYQFDTNTGRMTQYSFNVNGQSAVGKLNWNANGTLQQLAITDPFNSLDNQTCNNTYDDLVRVTGNNCGSAWAQTFSYDAFGNVTKSGSIAWQPGYTNTTTNQNINQYQLSGASYDANGNLKTDTFNTYTWDEYGDLASANGKTVTYDAFGRMVQNSSGYEFVWFPIGSQALATMQGQSLSNAAVPLPGGAFAMYNASGLFQYNHPDWLGSARLFSTTSRTATPAMSYAPFGEGYAGGQQWIQFTSTGNAWTVADNENQTGSLEDFKFRRYSPVQGRWISPDPAGLAVVDPTNPQSWNRYAYVAGNPLSATDPTGLGGPTGVACHTGWNAHTPNCVRSSLNCTEGDGYCPPESLNNDALAMLVYHGCDEECRHESIITTGWDPYLGKDRSTVQYGFAGVNNGYGRITEQQLELAAIQLGKAACADEGSAAIAGCIQDAYNTITVPLDANKNCASASLVGGNCNFGYLGVEIQGQFLNPESLSGCSSSAANTRCGVLDSLHFHIDPAQTSYGTFHVDTGNAWSVPLGSLVHLGWDIVGGQTVWSQAGIPRPWW